MQPILLSIDVGTHTLRSAMVTPDGHIVAHDEEPLLLRKTQLNMEFSSDNIWHALTNSVNRLLNKSSVSPHQIMSIGIDTTYSLVLLDKKMQPVFLSHSNKTNVIGWMDHRSSRQASYIASHYPDLLNGASSQVTPESNLSKICWLCKEAPGIWRQTHHLMDLWDFLTWKCTGHKTIAPYSTGSLLSNSVFSELDVDIQDRLEGEPLPFCSAIGSGLSRNAAVKLCLIPGIPVATGMIDSPAGALTTMLASHRDSKIRLRSENITKRLSMIVGTSSAYMAFSQRSIKAHGICGPFPSPLQGYQMNLVRQTACGSLIDHIITSHPAYDSAVRNATNCGISIYDYLYQKLKNISSDNKSLSRLTSDLHILPYFAGNHCPRVDFSLQGMIIGTTLDKSQESLAKIYLATIQSLALGARHNLEKLEQSGYRFELLMPAGGLAKNTLFMQEHVNAMNCPAALPEQHNPMLMSGALIGSVAAGIYLDVEQAMRAMSRYTDIIQPEEQLNSFYNSKYSVFLELYEDQMKYRKLMGNETKSY